MTTAIADEALRTRVEQRFGAWNCVWEQTLKQHPAYLRSAADFADATSGAALDPRTRAFVRLALNANATHLHADALTSAIGAARAAGASVEEIFEVLLVSCTIGVHGMNADILAEVLTERGDRDGTPELSAPQHAIREEYKRTRGYWRDFLDPTLELAPEFLAAYLEFSGAPWREGVLPPKVREFIYLAFDTSPTHMHMAGLRVHINNALNHGATVDEIVAVMGMSAGLGMQTLELAVPLLADQAARPTEAEEKADSEGPRVDPEPRP